MMLSQQNAAKLERECVQLQAHPFLDTTGNSRAATGPAASAVFGIRESAARPDAQRSRASTAESPPRSNPETCGPGPRTVRQCAPAPIAAPPFAGTTAASAAPAQAGTNHAGDPPRLCSILFRRAPWIRKVQKRPQASAMTTAVRASRARQQRPRQWPTLHGLIALLSHAQPRQWLASPTKARRMLTRESLSCAAPATGWSDLPAGDRLRCRLLSAPALPMRQVPFAGVLPDANRAPHQQRRARFELALAAALPAAEDSPTPAGHRCWWRKPSGGGF